MKDGEWRLWTSFRIDMTVTNLDRGRDAPHRPYVGLTDVGEDGNEVGVLAFRTREGHVLRHEKPEARRKPGRWRVEPSPRDGGGYFYECRPHGFVMLEGSGAIAGAKAFSAAYLAHQRHYCNFTS